MWSIVLLASMAGTTCQCSGKAVIFIKLSWLSTFCIKLNCHLVLEGVLFIYIFDAIFQSELALMLAATYSALISGKFIKEKFFFVPFQHKTALISSLMDLLSCPSYCIGIFILRPRKVCTVLIRQGFLTLLSSDFGTFVFHTCCPTTT